MYILATYSGGGPSRARVRTLPMSITGPLIRGIALAGSCPNCLRTRSAMSLIKQMGKALRSGGFTPNSQMHRKRMLFIVRPALCRGSIGRTRTRLGATGTGLRCTIDDCRHVGRTVGDSTIDHVRCLRTRDRITTYRTTMDGTRTTLGATHAGLDCYCIGTPYSKIISISTCSIKTCVNNTLRPIGLTAICGSGHVCSCFGVTSGRCLACRLTRRTTDGVPTRARFMALHLKASKTRS